MTRIFLTQTPASAGFAEHLRQELRAKGYTLPEYPPIEAASAPTQIERAMIGSAAVVLLWEGSAASAEWEALHIHLPQRFQKPLFPLLLDATPLPTTIADLATLSGQLPAAATVAALVSLPGFPPSRTNDPLLALYEEATSDTIRLRKAAIGKAATMLAQDQHRDAILTLLTYLAEHDPLTIRQKEANQVLLADAQKHTPTPPFSPVQAAMMVGGRCEQGHLSYYNKRLICQQYHQVAYAPTTNQRQQDELVVPCQQPGCPLKVVVRVECGAYR
ncbi:MAG TPA: hypothetical protein VFV38_22485 [Ktedonobacteraceae bacterium]|nr:hypothetical protein [Ktedonobacteraceae bacterium]